MKIFEKIKIHKQRELYFFNRPLLSYGECFLDGKREKYIDIFPSKSFKEKLFDKIINYLKEQNIEYDDIYIVRFNIGETVLLSGLIKGWYKKNDSKNPILILTQKYHEDIIKIYCPNIRYIYYPIEKIILDKLLQDINYSYGKTNIYYYMPIKYVVLSKDGKHFSKYIQEVLNIDCYNYSNSLDTNVKNLNNFIKENINLNKLIIVSPESTSCSPIKKIFWNKLIKRLQQLNYCIFCNCINKEHYYPNTYSYKLSLFELYALAQKSKAIIGMRSGLLDYLASIKNLNIFALYSRLEYWNINVNDVLSAYTLTELPFDHAKNINEYNIENYSIDELIDNIVKKLEVEDGKK